MLVQTAKPKRNGIFSVKKELPPIPDKLYFSIGEISALCGLEAHVLRYWEQEFVQLRPARRRGNRRYYQRKDVLLVRRIRSLLYEQGFTIEGAKGQLGNTNNNNRIAIADDISDDQVKSLLNKVASSIEEIMVDLGEESV